MFLAEAGRDHLGAFVEFLSVLAHQIIYIELGYREDAGDQVFWLRNALRARE